MLLDESARWIASNDREWPYSFLNICDGLELEPDRLRSGLLRFVDDTRRSHGRRRQYYRHAGRRRSFSGARAGTA
jgi:hypothetical protein